MPRKLAVLLLLGTAWAGFSVTGCRPSANKRPTETTPGADAAGAESSTVDLPAGLSLAEYRLAEKQFKERFPQREVRREEALLMAADLAAADHKPDVAVACYRAIPSDQSEFGLAARLQEGLLLIENNRATEAEAAFQAYLERARVATRLAPQDVITAFKWLTFILSVEIRLEERKPLLEELHAIGLADPLDSKQLYFPQLLILNSAAGRTRIEQFLKNEPQNVRVRLAHARYKTLEGQFDVGIELLEQLHKEYPADKGIAAALLEAYFESGQAEKLGPILASLPPHQPDEPWLLVRMRAESAMLAKDYPTAEQLFKAALAQDPTYAACQIGLSRVYAAQGNSEAQQQALNRSTIMADIRVNLTKVQPNAAAAASELAVKCTELGLTDAAKAFETHAENIKRSQAAAPQSTRVP